MERSRLLECLADDYLRLRFVGAADLTADVPTCPGWTVDDLVRHVAEVYLHKVTIMRTGAWPDPWPPAETAGVDPIALLDRTYGELIEEFAHRGDADPSRTWHEHDQTVGFWIRRMAQETVIHRLDAELAVETSIAAIPDDLAADGIDELLKLFVGYGSHAWLEDFAPQLAGAKGRTVSVRLDTGPGWLVQVNPTGVDVTDLPASTSADLPDATADATVGGAPVPVLRWLWARESTPTADAPSLVRVDGDEEAIKELREFLSASTQ